MKFFEFGFFYIFVEKRRINVITKHSLDIRKVKYLRVLELLLGLHVTQSRFVPRLNVLQIFVIKAIRSIAYQLLQITTSLRPLSTQSRCFIIEIFLKFEKSIRPVIFGISSTLSATFRFETGGFDSLLARWKEVQFDI